MQPYAIINPVVRFVPLSNQIRAAIKASGMSRAEICRRIDLDKGVMSRFMTGKCGLALKTLDRLGQLLDMRIECRRPGGRRMR